MIAIDNNLIEKVKLFNLGKSHIRKDFSFDFTPEIFDYEKEKFDSLLLRGGNYAPNGIWS